MNIQILEQYAIPYVMEVKKTKHMRIRFDQQAVLHITYPLGCKIERLESFISKHIEWILEKRSQSLEKIVTYTNGSRQYVFGETCTLQINLSKTKRIDKIGDMIMVSVHDIKDVRKDMLQWRRELAENAFEQLLYACFMKMEHELATFPKMVIQQSKTKWGCCYIHENKIMLNVALTQVPFELIEYVICHELTHFIVHNHSKLFHDQLSQYVTEERTKAKMLKKYPNIL